jgi:glycosyltransferase involved in cell wall biosynthesis
MRDEVAGLLVPSKYAAALAAGKPVLLVGGEGADLFQEIEELKIGWVCRHDSLEVREAIVEAINHPGRSTEMGESGRRVFENRYSHKISRRRWMELMESLEVRS